MAYVVYLLPNGRLFNQSSQLISLIGAYNTRKYTSI